ncbi:IQ and ubiquitin-like domain-containing protein [Hondaea fermentalgiana]|uniref:IQ and ubiquitin-like domain-containing protein n=1 Tax=Hondaea fermentalgiana TaxID=2315210 RepID=A0A2R5GRY3_9STRA|nr:IQ and ubiquitin-like domain-containing protein [Hondaea fermentalgiana]|eukprot:GBG33646.1 IQ and ubiquitin-like domain-containing protein [Hondaea fermentalgiana]
MTDVEEKEAHAGEGEEKHQDDEAKARDESDEQKTAPAGPVTLRFRIQPEGFPHLLDVEPSCPIKEIKERLGQDLQLPTEALQLKGCGLESATSVSHLNPGTEHDVEVHIIREIAAAASTYKMPETLEVVIHYDEDEDLPSRTVSVKIVREDLETQKPYLGGYRNKKTGAVYHHAFTQRESEKLREAQAAQAAGDDSVKYTRETQTAVEVSCSAQTRRETGTQMKRSDLHVDEAKDKTINPREDYFDSEQSYALKVQASISLQRFWRGFMARCLAHTMRDRIATRQLEQRKLRERREREEKEQHEREVQRRMHPTTAADFEVLYNELDNWRQHETTRIKSSTKLTPEQKQLELEELLRKETKLLQTIDRLKLTAHHENKSKRIDKLLSMMATPKKWQLSDGDVTLVHTPFTTRAQELADLYKGLGATGLSVDERLDILLHVKWTAKEFPCDLTRDLIDLIDREADLLNRGRSESLMHGLRKRISTLFLQFIETPEFNPEAARFLQVPSDLLRRPQIMPK